MYGNFEYGSIPYGDAYVVTVTIVIRVGDIDVIFTANRRALLFISENKKDLFSSKDPHTTTFKSNVKDSPFISLKKSYVFME